MRKFRLKIGVDVDDVLFSCNAYAIELANKEHHYDPPIELKEITLWGKTGTRVDERLAYYEKEEFYRDQPVLPGAKAFVKELLRYGEVFFITAVDPRFMNIRAKRLLEEFPDIPKQNLIMGSNKQMIKTDILLDDGAHNIASSESAYPVLMRRPWNQHITGCLSVNNYGEFLTLLDTILSNIHYQEVKQEVQKNQVFVLIGPSASGKTSLMERLIADGFANRIRSYTTRSRREKESKDAYHFVSRSEFHRMEEDGSFFETTSYAGERYGSTLKEVTDILANKHAVVALDICGAIALKHHFGTQAVLIYLSREREKLLTSILERRCSTEEKVKRILSLDDEMKNEELCDVTLENNGSVRDLVQQFYNKFQK